MAYDDRKSIFRKIEKLRGGRTLVCFFNFDRHSEPEIPGLSTQLNASAKEALFRVLKESTSKNGVDVCLYTRGGDVNSVWPIVSLVREFDPDFEVLLPFRCHSGGTLIALAARRIVMSSIAELSPIDPSTGNQFNPRDPSNPKQRLAISVEDVRAYKSFICEQFKDPAITQSQPSGQLDGERFQPFIERLTNKVHPLALGNVQRVLMQIKQLAENLLRLHAIDDQPLKIIVESFTTKFYSHLHMINRQEAREILGDRVEHASTDLGAALDDLLRSYEDAFKLREKFFLRSHLGDSPREEVRFIGGAIESKAWSYLYETKAEVLQYSRIPSNVQIQIPDGQPMPLIPGLPREIEIGVVAERWMHNIGPLGVTA